MFTTRIPEKFMKADGKPWRKEKEDGDGNPINVLGQDGKPIVLATTPKGEPVYKHEVEDADYLDILKLFLNNLFNLVAAKAKENKELKLLTMEDSSFALDCFRAMNVARGSLELEKAPHEWLKDKLSRFGADVFGVNAAIIFEPLKTADEITPTRAETRRNIKG